MVVFKSLIALRLDRVTLYAGANIIVGFESRSSGQFYRPFWGLTCDDAEELQYLLAEAAQKSDAVPTENDQYGQRYCLDFAVTRLGQTATIRSTWIIRIAETFPRLTRCYIIKTKPWL